MCCGKGPCRRDLCTLICSKDDGSSIPVQASFLDMKTHDIVWRGRLKDRKDAEKEETRVHLTRDSWAIFSRLRKQHRLRELSGNHILYNKHFRPLTPSSLNHYLSTMCAATLPCFQGKKCTCTLLRRMFVTYKRRGDLSLAEKTDMAKNMGHSLGT